MKKICVLIIILVVWTASVNLLVAQQVDINNEIRTHKNVAEEYFYNKEYKKAQDEYKKVLKLAPKDIETLIRLGELYSFSAPEYEDYKKAIKYYKRALELSPRNLEVLINLGLIYAAQGNNSKAIKFYKEVLEINPKQSKALNYLANVYLNMEDYNNAQIYATKALEVNPDLPAIHYTLGEIYLAQGYHFAALTEFKKAMVNANLNFKQYIQKKIDKVKNKLDY